MQEVMLHPGQFMGLEAAEAAAASLTEELKEADAVLGRAAKYGLNLSRVFDEFKTITAKRARAENAKRLALTLRYACFAETFFRTPPCATSACTVHHHCRLLLLSKSKIVFISTVQLQ